MGKYKVPRYAYIGGETGWIYDGDISPHELTSKQILKHIYELGEGLEYSIHLNKHYGNPEDSARDTRDYLRETKYFWNLYLRKKNYD